MKLKKIILVGVLVVVTNLGTWFLSSHTIVWGVNHLPVYTYDNKTALDIERQYCMCMIEMLHMYWQNYDVEYDEKGEVISRHTFFDDCIAETDVYLKADSLNEGDWEDFFTEW